MYMKHSIHGFTHAVGQEIVENKKNGWVECDINEEIKKKSPAVTESISDVETPEDAYEKKFGKKAHHRMTQESIIKALEE